MTEQNTTHGLELRPYVIRAGEHRTLGDYVFSLGMRNWAARARTDELTSNKTKAKAIAHGLVVVGDSGVHRLTPKGRALANDIRHYKVNLMNKKMAGQIGSSFII